MILVKKILFLMAFGAFALLTGCTNFPSLDPNVFPPEAKTLDSCQNYTKICPGPHFITDPQGISNCSNLIDSCMIDINRLTCTQCAESFLGTGFGGGRTYRCSPKADNACQTPMTQGANKPLSTSSVTITSSQSPPPSSGGSGTSSSTPTANLPTTTALGGSGASTIQTDTLTCGSNQFTGFTGNAGYTYSQVSANGTSSSGNTGNVGVGYTKGMGCANIAGTVVQPTIGAVVTQNIGSMGSTSSGGTTVGCSRPGYPICPQGFITTINTSSTSKISNPTAMTLQAGAVLGKNTQLYVNGGVVVADKNGATSTGGRVGAGGCQGINNTLAACVEANHDQVGGTGVNSLSIGIKVSLPQ